MNYKITNNDVIPCFRSGRRASELSKVIRSLQLNQSVHVPSDGLDSASGQRRRLSSMCVYASRQTGSRYSIRIRPDRSFDVYCIEAPAVKSPKDMMDAEIELIGFEE